MADIIKIRRSHNYAGSKWFQPTESNRLTDRQEITKHPTFDEFFPKHEKFCWSLAVKCSKKFGGESEDYIGSIVLRFNRMLYHFDKTKGSLTTLCHWRVFRDILYRFVRFDSESRSIYWAATTSTDEEIKSLTVNYSFHEAGLQIYRVPDVDEEWAQEIIDNFEKPMDCWDFLTKTLHKRDKKILEGRFREGQTLDELGKIFNISKERVRQIQASAIRDIRTRLKRLERWVQLFDDNK